MADVRVLVLRAAGTNCDLETLAACERAGGIPERVHIRAVIDQPARLGDFQIIIIPGGFSYGDDLGAGRIFAAQIERHLLDGLRERVARGALLLGICNGFQVLVKTGLLPAGGERGGNNGRRTCSITYNEPRGFQDRWVRLRAGESKCAFLEPGETFDMPIAHGEGRVVFAHLKDLQQVESAGGVALRYVPANTNADGHDASADLPYNPNGSVADIAGLCDSSGRVFGLMPHPDRFIDWTQHPCWTRLPAQAAGDGLRLFQRAVAHFR